MPYRMVLPSEALTACFPCFVLMESRHERGPDLVSRSSAIVGQDKLVSWGHTWAGPLDRVPAEGGRSLCKWWAGLLAQFAC